MTTKSINRTSRETSAYVRDKGLRAVIVTIHHSMIELRAKGLRQRETVDIGSIYYRAVRERVNRERIEKREARKRK